MKKSDRSISDWNSVSRTKLAAIFGVDARTVSRWIAAGLPKLSTGMFSVPQAFTWRLSRNETEITDLQKKRTEGGADNEDSKYLELFRKERWRLSKLERLQKQGALISSEAVYSEFAGRASELRQSLLAVPSRLSPILELKKADEVRVILRSEVLTMLENFCRNGAYISNIQTGENKNE